MTERLLTRDQVLAIPDEELPLLVFARGIRSFLGWGIAHRTRGQYNHVMWLHRKGRLASQGVFYRDIPATDYLNDRYMLKLVRYNDMTMDQLGKLLQSIRDDLNLPWWRRLYDFVGTFLGQWFLPKWVQIPGLWFCSERVARDLSTILPHVPVIPPPSPADLNRWTKSNRPHWSVYGRFDPDAD